MNKDLLGNSIIDFNCDFLQTQLITYIGNKRSLLSFINQGIDFVKFRLNKTKLNCMDGFSGSGVVSRLLKYHSEKLISNDLEKYSYLVNKCYLSNKSELDLKYIKETIDVLNNLELKDGFITKNYAPQDDNNIKENERVFYTHKNAQILDTIKQYIYIYQINTYFLLH